MPCNACANCRDHMTRNCSEEIGACFKIESPNNGPQKKPPIALTFTAAARGPCAGRGLGDA